jgi:hypothetical protein
MPNTQPQPPTAAQVERCQERLTSLTTSFAYAAPEVGHHFQAEASECLNTIARYFGLVGSQNAPADGGRS